MKNRNVKTAVPNVLAPSLGRRPEKEPRRLFGDAAAAADDIYDGKETSG